MVLPLGSFRAGPRATAGPRADDAAPVAGGWASAPVAAGWVFCAAILISSGVWALVLGLVSGAGGSFEPK